MIKVLISDFSRTILFPKQLNEIEEMNQLNRKYIAEVLGKDISEITPEELKNGGRYYTAEDVFLVNKPLLQEYKKLKDLGVYLIIFTSGYVQHHSGLKNNLTIFDEIVNVETLGGLDKENPEAYRSIVKNLKKDFPTLNTRDVLFVDDAQNNLDAANEAGLRTFLFPKYNHEWTQEVFFHSSAREFNRFIETLL